MSPQSSGRSVDPIAVCSLPPDGLAERLAWIRAEILPHALARTSLADGIAWELDDAPGLVAILDRLVELERDCCSGIVFEHTAVPGTRRRRLAVRGIDPDADPFGDAAAR